MRTNLPRKINDFESGIINLDSFKGEGTHWTAYVKRMSVVNYFDSYGNLKPPIEVINYFKSGTYPVSIYFNHKQYQKFNTINCGHLCLKFLYKMNNM